MAEKKINGRTFKCDESLATEALILQARVLNILGLSLDEVQDAIHTVFQAKASGDGDALKSALQSKVFNVILAAFAKVEPKVYMALVRDIVQMAQVQGPSGDYHDVDIDGDFHGDKKSIYPVMFFVLVTQFQDFFGGVLASGFLKKMGKG